MTAKTYLQAPEEVLLPLYESGDLSIQDNAPVHVKNGIPEWLEEHGIWTIEWPPHSPDLNLIEHVWHALKRKVYELEPKFQDLKLSIPQIDWAKQIIKQARSEIDPDLVNTLITSIADQLRAVKRVRGWYTH